MSLWRNARDELAGAWRSLRYDLRRRSGADTTAAMFDDGVPTVPNIFGGPAPHRLDIEPDAYDRPRRRLVAVSAFGLLAAVGAAGSYFAVVNGLGVLLAEEPGRPDANPLAAEAGPAPIATGPQTPTSRLGYGTTLAPIPAPQAEPRRTKIVRRPATPAPSLSARLLTTTPPRTAAPVLTPCRCTPPVPTPTFPNPGPSGYPTASPSGSASPWPSGSGSPSPSPSASADEDDRQHHTRGNDGY